MFKLVLKKILQALVTLWGLATIVFILFQAIPSDPARMMLDQREDEEQLKAIRARYGFDKPLPVQYLYYINDLSPLSINSNTPGDYTYPADKYSYIRLLPLGKYSLILKFPYLRQSYQRDGLNVSSIIGQTLPNTVVLAVVAMTLAMIIGIFIGILAALWRDSVFDRAVSVLGSIGMSVPSFFAAIIVAWVFGYLLHDYTGLSMTGNLYTIDNLGRGEYLTIAAIILPAITLGMRPLAVVIQLMRGSLIDVMSQDYIRTARAKGLSTYAVILKHALRNALNPVSTAASGWFAGMLAGAVFIEYIFAWNGLGKAIVDALNSMDLPVVMGSVLVIASIFILINIFVDVIYAWLDPRIRTTK